MRPGDTWTFEETDTTGARERVVIEVLDETRRVANGITARVVRDTATEDGVPTEVTDHVGSWEAGVDGAQAGVSMPAEPRPGMRYRQEYYRGEAEDNGAVVTVGEEQVEVPFGHFKGVLMTRDTSTIEPKVEELKFYARGVGPLLSVHTDGEGGRATLINFESGA